MQSHFLLNISLLLMLVVVLPGFAQHPPPEAKEGEPAPDFILQDVAGKNSVKLSELKGKPVVLIFGSCT